MPNDDLISREALLEALSEKPMVDVFPNWKDFDSDLRHILCKLGDAFEHEIEAVPAVDAEPVIRCGDCENWDTDWTPFNCESKIMHWCPMIDCVTEADFYCAYGKKQEEKT